MLIIPLTDKLSWRNPPIITILLILLNCLVFFSFQLRDNSRFYDAHKFLWSSGLAEIEMEKYIQHTDASVSMTSLYDSEGELNQEQAYTLYGEMSKDNDFLTKLQNDEIITPQDPQYSKWKSLRDDYEYKRSKITTINYGL